MSRSHSSTNPAPYSACGRRAATLRRRAKDLPPGWLVYELAQSHFRIIAPGGETYRSLGAARAAIMADGG